MIRGFGNVSGSGSKGINLQAGFSAALVVWKTFVDTVFIGHLSAATDNTV